MEYELSFEVDVIAKTRLKKEITFNDGADVIIDKEIMESPENEDDIDLALFEIVFEKTMDRLHWEKKDAGMSMMDEFSELTITIKNMEVKKNSET